MARILRLQNAAGDGPYSNFEWHNPATLYTTLANRPLPPGDLLWNMQMGWNGAREYRFGFRNVKQARAWFNDAGERKRLRALGYRFRWVNGTIAGDDGKQVWFKPEPEPETRSSEVS